MSHGWSCANLQTLQWCLQREAKPDWAHLALLSLLSVKLHGIIARFVRGWGTLTLMICVMALMHFCGILFFCRWMCLSSCNYSFLLSHTSLFCFFFTRASASPSTFLSYCILSLPYIVPLSDYTSGHRRVPSQNFLQCTPSFLMDFLSVCLFICHATVLGTVRGQICQKDLLHAFSRLC